MAGPHGMSVERIAALVGVPAECVTGITLARCLGYCSENPKHEKLLSLSRNEALGKDTSQAPYLQAEEVAGMSALSFVVPPEGPHPESTVSSGPNGVLVMVVTIEGALLQLAPISFSPAEPTAGMPVEFAQPRAVGGLQGASPVTLRWTFGDGTTSTEAAPKHVYIPVAQNGTTRYEVSVEVVVRNFKGEEIAAGAQVVTVPVKSMEAAKPPAREPTAPTGITPIPAPPTPTPPAPAGIDTSEAERQAAPTRGAATPTKVPQTSTKKKTNGTTSAKAGIPAKVRAALLKHAKCFADRYRERHPYDIQAVLTTDAKAQKLDEARNGSLKTTHEKVYVVAMRGTFRVKCKGGPCPAWVAPRGRRSFAVLVAWVSASTMKPLGSDVFISYPSLASAGTPIRLEQPHRT